MDGLLTHKNIIALLPMADFPSDSRLSTLGLATSPCWVFQVANNYVGFIPTLPLFHSRITKNEFGQWLWCWQKGFGLSWTTLYVYTMFNLGHLFVFYCTTTWRQHGPRRGFVDILGHVDTYIEKARCRVAPQLKTNLCKEKIKK